MLRPAIIALVLSLCLACTSQDTKPGLTIACAASAQFAVRELASSFDKSNALQIDVITGSSGRLTTQIINGAPFDIFFSANTQYPDLLYEQSMTNDRPDVYGKGIPVVWTLREDLDLEKLESLLLSPAIKRVAIADPKNAPYGIMAQQFLKDKDWYDLIKHKLVFGESISQVNEYVINQTVDIGVSAKSIVNSPKLKGQGKVLELKKEYWIPQGIIAMNKDHSTKLKENFLQYVRSEEGKGILKKYGFAF